MAGLFSTTHITAIENIQGNLKTYAGNIRDVLNATALTPENKRLNPFHTAVAMYDALKEAIIQAEATVISNEDTYTQ